VHTRKFDFDDALFAVGVTCRFDVVQAKLGPDIEDRV